MGSKNRGADGSPLGIAIRPAPAGIHVIELVGELDLSTIPKLEARLMDALSSHDLVVLDLSRLTFIDSSGIGLLIQAHQTEGGALRTILSRGSQAERVFNIAGIDRVLAIFFDRDEAVAPRKTRRRRRPAAA